MIRWLCVAVAVDCALGLRTFAQNFLTWGQNQSSQCIYVLYDPIRQGTQPDTIPIDKAGNNEGNVYKKFYVRVILNEIGNIGEPSETYTNEGKDEEQIIHDDCLYTDHLIEIWRER